MKFFSKEILLVIMTLVCTFSCAGKPSHSREDAKEPDRPELLDNQENIDLQCLRLSYPQIENIERTPRGHVIRLKNGNVIPYRKHAINGDAAYDLRESMEIAYPLEPNRTVPAKGASPGRKRPYDFFNSLYGHSRHEVAANTVSVPFFGKNIRLEQNAAKALQMAIPELRKIGADPEIKKLLIADGGFFWRNIAGEKNLSAHSYGIAIDLSPGRAPYWRWSKIQPHPMQFSYPGKIVEIMEKHGFIWGGKWHEYDLMHFEYRPELICKAKMLASRQKK